MSTEPTAKIIADSISPDGYRVTTMEVTMHRFVLAEFNTHRVFSRNSASSRAIPVHKQLKKFTDNPWMPLSWDAEQRGMQGGSELEGEDLADAKELFYDIHEYTSRRVQEYIDSHPDKNTRLHKSKINRLYEWGQEHKVIVTSTYWQGFWDQRVSALAQPEIHKAAEAMLEAYNASEPEEIELGWWHMPYIDRQVDGEALQAYMESRGWDVFSREAAREGLELLKQISAARCARVSYLTHDGKRDLQKDIDLYNFLISADPMHASPLEHVCTPASYAEVRAGEVRGNLVGWYQLRHHVEDDRALA